GVPALLAAAMPRYVFVLPARAKRLDVSAQPSVGAGPPDARPRYGQLPGASALLLPASAPQIARHDDVPQLRVAMPLLARSVAPRLARPCVAHPRAGGGQGLRVPWQSAPAPPVGREQSSHAVKTDTCSRNRAGPQCRPGP